MAAFTGSVKANRSGGYSMVKTHTAPPEGTVGTSFGKKRAPCVVMPRASPSHPDSTARYCVPSTVNVVGGARMPELRPTRSASALIDGR
jgi:hypothetical protein